MGRKWEEVSSCNGVWIGSLRDWYGGRGEEGELSLQVPFWPGLFERYPWRTLSTG